VTDLKLGRKPKTEDPRDWRYEDFRASLKAAGKLPKLPAIFGHGNTFRDWGMFGNGPDPSAPGAASRGCGDCVWASAAHETMGFLTNASPIAPTIQHVAMLFDGATTVSDYAAATGYDPQTGEGDNGTEIRASLTYRQTTGIIDKAGNRHKIGAFVALDPSDLDHLLEAIYLFEGVPLGVTVTEAQMSQFEQRFPVWTPVAGSPVLGGHGIPAVGRPDSKHLAVITWGKRIAVTPDFIASQCEEAWAYLTPERISKVTGKSYEGADQAQLEECLHLLAATG
jgi:hypothetical protein